MNSQLRSSTEAGRDGQALDWFDLQLSDNLQLNAGFNLGLTRSADDWSGSWASPRLGVSAQ
jgi:hypothetical protein